MGDALNEFWTFVTTLENYWGPRGIAVRGWARLRLAGFSVLVASVLSLQAGNSEFIIYIAVMVVISAALVLVHRRVGLGCRCRLVRCRHGARNSTVAGRALVVFGVEMPELVALANLGGRPNRRRTSLQSPSGSSTSPSWTWAQSAATFSPMNTCCVPVYMSRKARSSRLPSRIAVVPAARCAQVAT